MELFRKDSAVANFRTGPQTLNCQEETFVDKTDLTTEVVDTSESQSDPTDAVISARKKFVTPEISVPVDVLEATTFFQGVTSGRTN